MSIRLMLPALALAAFASFSASAPARADACADAQDQATLNECADREYKKADAELNAAFEEIERRLEGQEDTKARFVEAQRAWITFRDAECRFANTNSESGTIFPMLQAACLSAQTQARVEQLKTYLACEEGDLGCPVPTE